MSTIEVKRDGSAVRITVYVCGKVARLRVTPEYARNLALDLLSAAAATSETAEASSPETWLERLQRILDGR